MGPSAAARDKDQHLHAVGRIKLRGDRRAGGHLVESRPDVSCAHARAHDLDEVARRARADEWNRRADGSFDVERELPNRVRFGTKVVPQPAAVRMQSVAHERHERDAHRLARAELRDAQRRRRLHGADERQQGVPRLMPPVNRKTAGAWIITAWDPCQRAWGNEKCPCLHSDPQFPDCAPGKTQRLRGWLSFFEGENIEEELARIEATGWRSER